MAVGAIAGSGSAVAAPTGATAPHVVLVKHGVGTDRTRPFSVGGSWHLRYHFSCRAVGHVAKFKVTVTHRSGAPSTADAGPARRALSGHGSEFEPRGGHYYLDVSSPCHWTVKVVTGPRPTETELKGELLTLNDLPIGWGIADAGPNRDGPLGFCALPEATSGFSRAAVVFQDGSTGLVAGEVLRGFNSASDAEGYFLDHDSAALSCTTYTAGGKTYQIQATDFPSLGDRSFAVEITNNGVVLDEAFIQVGHTIVQVSTAGAASQPSLELRLAQRAIPRVQ
ncbi:MAG TPA: hypothetical protein VG708_09480 [Mycobacteriales bacterium]|nr:hypothetical protein [Mycobacteriales bacterium]